MQPGGRLTAHDFEYVEYILIITCLKKMFQFLNAASDIGRCIEKLIRSNFSGADDRLIDEKIYRRHSGTMNLQV